MLCLVCGMFKKSGKHYVSFELFFEDIGFLESLLLFAMRPNKSMLSFSAGSNDKFDCPQISRMASYPISTPPRTAAGCAWWRSTPSCTDLTSPPSTRGMSSSHRASTSNPSFWTMQSLDFHFCATSTWWTPVLNFVIFLIIWGELVLETNSNKQEYHDLDLSSLYFINT